ncbi:MarR family winged helix-turn-helix transcriptional regulator [Streptomyces sp. NPDC003401]
MTHLDGPGEDHTDGPPDGPEGMALEIADAVENLTSLWSAAAHDATLRLSPHQLRALRALQDSPGLNLTALAECLDIGLPTASRLCDRLEAAGLLDRSFHPRRRREVQLMLTAAGQEVLGEVAGRRAQALAVALGVMDPVDRDALRRGLMGFLRTGRTGPSRSPGSG